MTKSELVTPNLTLVALTLMVQYGSSFYLNSAQALTDDCEYTCSAIQCLQGIIRGTRQSVVAYQRSCTLAEKRQKKRRRFLATSQRNKSAVITKSIIYYALINTRALTVPFLQRHKKLLNYLAMI